VPTVSEAVLTHAVIGSRLGAARLVAESPTDGRPFRAGPFYDSASTITGAILNKPC
jgi:hypothetical protein